MVISKHKEINEWINKNGYEPVLFDENWKVLERGKDKRRTWGTGCYAGICFRCSKCNKFYPTYGALKYYHKKCLKEEE